MMSNDTPDFWKYPSDQQAAAEPEAKTRVMADAMGIPISFFAPVTTFQNPKGEIVWHLRSGDDVYQVEKLEAPVLRGAGERTHRLWRNGSPAIGHQWCYSLDDAKWWAEWLTERDLRIQISNLRTRMLALESKLARQRFEPQPY